jgi:hypothetical protein
MNWVTTPLVICHNNTSLLVLTDGVEKGGEESGAAPGGS